MKAFVRGRWRPALVLAIFAVAVVPMVGSRAAEAGIALPWQTAGAQPERVSVVTRVLADRQAESREGSGVPDFEWIQPDRSLRRLSDLRGTVVIVNVWATWCVPCRLEMPAFDRVAADDPALIVLAVNAGEDEKTVVTFFEEHRLRHLVPMIDGSGALARRYAVVGLPTTLVIRPDGTVSAVIPGGPIDEGTIGAAIARARTRR